MSRPRVLRTFVHTVVAGAALLSPAPTRGQDPGLLVSAGWLADHLDDPNVVVLWVSAEESYAEEHIPGAVLVGRDEMSHPGSHSADALVLELPEAAAFQRALRAWGVNDDSHVVVAFGADERVTFASRLMFTLDWAGLGSRSSFLDGGLVAWKAGGHPVTSEVTTPAPGNVTISPRANLVVDADWIQANGGSAGVQVVDARAPAFFDGVREDRGVAGHIPGSGNVHWMTLIDEETLRLHPVETLRALFEAAGVAAGDTVAGYCHIGQYATLMLLSARILGHDVVLYDGAFQDWATRGLPAETGK